MKQEDYGTYRGHFLQQLQISRRTLLGVLILTVVNGALFFTGSRLYLLFSAAVPYYLAVLGWQMNGGLGTQAVAGLALGGGILALYLVAYLLSRRDGRWLLAAAILMGLDLLALLALAVWTDSFWSHAVDLMFHGLAIYQLGSGFGAARKLRSLPQPPPLYREWPTEANEADHP